jgi:hypothetical protein
MKEWIILLIITIATTIFVIVKTNSDLGYYADYGKLIYWGVWILFNLIMWILYFIIKWLIK